MQASTDVRPGGKKDHIPFTKKISPTVVIPVSTPNLITIPPTVNEPLPPANNFPPPPPVAASQQEAAEFSGSDSSADESIARQDTGSIIPEASKPVPASTQEPVTAAASESLPGVTQGPSSVPVRAEIPVSVPRVSSTQVNDESIQQKSEGPINKFVYQIFGRPASMERDSKWQKPWQSHVENLKPAVSREQVPVDNSPGAFRQTINKIVIYLFGGILETERDPKWAQPWQTHPENKRTTIVDDRPKVKAAIQTGGIIHKFVTIFFEDPKGDRDPKYAVPWQSHDEQIRKYQVIEKEEPKPKVVVHTGGIINKFISIFFEEPKGERDPKYAEPWQTHEEQIRKFRDVEDEGPKEKVAIPTGGFIHKFVRIFFGEPQGPRDPKYAEPWQKHDEQIRKFQSSVDEEAKPKVVVSTGGILHKFITLFFADPKGERDPKFAQPWQTHIEQIRKFQSPTQDSKPERVIIQTGGILDKIVKVFFPGELGERDPKYAKPWQSHKEHTKKVSEEQHVQIDTSPGVISTSINKFVATIFGKTEGERDLKWSKPWQTHDISRLALQGTSSSFSQHVDVAAPPRVAPPVSPPIAARSPPPAAAPAPPSVTVPAPPVTVPAPPPITTPPPQQVAAPTAPLPVATSVPPKVTIPAKPEVEIKPIDEPSPTLKEPKSISVDQTLKKEPIATTEQIKPTSAKADQVDEYKISEEKLKSESESLSKTASETIREESTFPSKTHSGKFNMR